MVKRLLFMPTEDLRCGMEGMQQALEQGVPNGPAEEAQAALGAVRLLLEFAKEVLEERRQAGCTA